MLSRKQIQKLYKQHHKASALILSTVKDEEAFATVYGKEDVVIYPDHLIIKELSQTPVPHKLTAEKIKKLKWVALIESRNPLNTENVYEVIFSNIDDPFDVANESNLPKREGVVMALPAQFNPFN